MVLFLDEPTSGLDPVEGWAEEALMSLNVIRPSVGLALGLGAALLLFDAAGWRVVASMFDRERLVSGTRT